MTDRYNALTVVLEQSMRDDDAEAIMNAIRQLRGVVSVSGNVADVNTCIAKTLAKHELKSQIWGILKPE